MKDKLSWQERELALRLEIETKSKPYLTIHHPRQRYLPTDIRTRYRRLVMLKIARVEMRRRAVFLGQGPAWDDFMKSLEGEVLGNRRFVQAFEISAWVDQHLLPILKSAGTAANSRRPTIKIRRPNGNTPAAVPAKVIPFRPWMRNGRNPDKH
jgi:hypothetical protein